MIEFVAMLAAFVLILAAMGALADWWESDDRADARRRNHVSRPK